jgi:exodeoxyribonuclease X
LTAIVFDTETTGVNEPALIEAAWARLDDPTGLRVVERFEQRYAPGKPIELGAMATHHIVDADLEGCPPASAFSLPEGVAYLIGHNVDFDWQVAGHPAVRRIDTLCLARVLWPELDAYGLGALTYHLNDPHEARARLRAAHAAAADVDLCIDLLRAIVARLGPLPSWQALWERSEDARVPRTMPFGKHRGVPIAQVPADYKRWLRGQPDVDPYLRQALER